MLSLHYSQKLLNLSGVLIKDIFHADDTTTLYSELPRFVNCAKTMINWQQGILNIFRTPYTNGYIEGINNKIKVLKRNTFGYCNFKRFRNLILHICNKKIDSTILKNVLSIPNQYTWGTPIIGKEPKKRSITKLAVKLSLRCFFYFYIITLISF